MEVRCTGLKFKYKNKFEDMSKDEKKFLQDISTLKEDFSINIRKERIKKGLSKEDIANMTGLSEKTVSYIECHSRNVNLSSVIKYLSALDININSLFNTNN